MDISIIKANETNTTTGIKVGAADAPVTLVEFQNLACPYCRKWFEDKDEILSAYVEAGKVQRVIKLFDKEKPSLKRGNILHQYVPSSGDQILSTLRKIYAHQPEWRDEPADDAAVAAFAENELGLTKQDHATRAESIVTEAANASIQFVPTVLLNDHIFDENISNEELKALIEEALAK